MLRITPIKGGRDAINYYAGLVRQEQDEKAWERAQSEGRGRVDDYYLPGEDEGGRWWGQGTKALGLNGMGTREQLRAVFAGRHPVSGEQLGQAPRDNSIRAYDLTFSAPKTVSLLAGVLGGDAERDILTAHQNAVRAALEMLQERTTTRAGRNGVIRLDIGGLSVLEVRHRTSRMLDPQLHTHALVIARVQGSDGGWRALDATLAFKAVRMLGTVYQSALRSELVRRWPELQWTEVVKGQAEIDGLQDLAARFSRRTDQVKERYERLLDEWSASRAGAPPSDHQKALLKRRAARESRPAKNHARAADDLRRDWLGVAAEVGYDPARLERDALHRQRSLGLPEPADAAEVAREAIVALAAEKSVWTREDIEREVAARIDYRAGLSASSQQRAIESLAQDAARTYCIDLAVGRETGAKDAALLDREPALERYSTEQMLRAEQELVRWFHECAAGGGESAEQTRVASALAAVQARTESALTLDPEQTRATALMAGTNRAAVVIGPAGTGKTTTLRVAVTALRQEGRHVVALATSATAAKAIADAVTESVELPTENIARYLQERRRPDGVRSELKLKAGDTLILDEAGTVSTRHFKSLRAAVEADGARLVLVGDHRQLSAVGPGGMFEHARDVLPSVELGRVHRFRSPWEAEASLQLRAGRREPLDRYAEHGRIRTGEPDNVQQSMLDDWWQAHRAGVSYAFSVPTLQQANELSARAQQRRIDAGELDDKRHVQTERGQRLHVGDLVATRTNEGRREMVRGGRVRNREQWTVTAIHRDGSVVLTRQGASRTVEVSRDYARSNVELGYFSTVHAVQGRTVERGGTLVDENAGFRSVYVGMTRGRDVNRAYVIAPDKVDGRDVVERAMLRDRADLGVLAQRRTLEEVARRREALERRQRSRSLNALERARARELGDLGHGRDL